MRQHLFSVFPFRKKRSPVPVGAQTRSGRLWLRLVSLLIPPPCGPPLRPRCGPSYPGRAPAPPRPRGPGAPALRARPPPSDSPSTSALPGVPAPRPCLSCPPASRHPLAPPGAHHAPRPFAACAPLTPSHGTKKSPSPEERTFLKSMSGVESIPRSPRSPSLVSPRSVPGLRLRILQRLPCGRVPPRRPRVPAAAQTRSGRLWLFSSGRHMGRRMGRGVGRHLPAAPPRSRIRTGYRPVQRPAGNSF